MTTKEAQRKELADLVMRASKVARNNDQGLMPVGVGGEAVIRAADESLCKQVSALADRYNKIFNFQICTRQKFDAMTRIYKWCVGNGFDADWTRMTTLQLNCLKDAIEHAIETEQYEDF